MSNAYTVTDAENQFKATNVIYEVQAVEDLKDVFSPAHHGPRNIPVGTVATDSHESFTHFPIVETGHYALYVASPDAGSLKAQFLTGGAYSVEISTEEIKGSDLGGIFVYGIKTHEEILFNGDDPNPVAIKFTGCAGQAISYIVIKLDQ